MPNWTCNHVTIEGDAKALAQLKRELASKGNPFDFNTIIPMPDELRSAVPPLEIVGSQEAADAINADWRKRGFDDDAVRAITRAEHTRRITMYDAAEWYDWARKNWGTKWNACRAEVDQPTGNQLCYWFDTAWSPPEPIAVKLSKTCAARGLTLEWEAEDEFEGAIYGVIG